MTTEELTKASEQLIHEHSRLSGIPATPISRVMSPIDPTTGENA